MKKEWKKLLIKSAFFLVTLIFFDFLVGGFYRKFENAVMKHSPYDMVSQYTMREVKTDAVIIGASEVCHSYMPSILEDYLGITVYNCGKDGCFFLYQNAMINGILDRYSPKLIIWSITPTVFNTPTAIDWERLSQLNSFYVDYDFCHYILNKKNKFEPIKLLSNSYTFNSRLFPFIYKLFFPDKSYKKGGYFPLIGSKKDLEIKHQKWKDDYCEDCKEMFEHTIDRCTQSGVKIVCVLTPYYGEGEFVNLISYKELKQTLANNNIDFVENFYHDKSLMKKEYFKDNAHLNDSGAVVFTQKLSLYLVEKLFGGNNN